MGHDRHTQEYVAPCTSKEGDSLDSTYAQESKGSPQTSQEAMGTSLLPQEDPPSSITTKDVTVSSSSAQRAVGLSPCPQVSPEHIPSTPRALNSTLSSKGALKAVLPIKLSMKPDISIPKVLSSSPAKENSCRTSTSTQGGGLETSLPPCEALRPLTYIHGSLGGITHTQVALGPSPHSEGTLKMCTGIQGTLRPSPSEQEALGSTASKQSALKLSPSTQECSFCMPSLGRNSRHSRSNKVVPRNPVSRKNRLTVDPSDKGGFRNFPSDEDSFSLPTSAKWRLGSSPAAKETSKATMTPQVRPTPSISVPKTLECSTNGQGTLESFQSTQGHAGHSISSEEAQGTSLSTQKALVCSPSAPGLQAIPSSLPKAPEHFSHAPIDLTLCKIDFRATAPFQYFQGSKGNSTSKKRGLKCVTLVQKPLQNSMTSQASKNPSAQGSIEPLVSDQGEDTKHLSEADNQGQSISAQGSGGPSTCKAESLGSTHRKTQILPSNQGTEKHSLFSRGALGLPKSETRTVENLPSKQGLSSSSFSKGIKKPLLSSQGNVKTSSSAPCYQKPPQMTSVTPTTVRHKQGTLEHSMSRQGTVDSLPSISEFPEHSTSFQKKVGHSSHMVEPQDTSLSIRDTIGPLPPRGAMGWSKSETRTLENLCSDKEPTYSTQGSEETLLSSQGRVKPSSSSANAQKSRQMTSGTLPNMRCKQGPLEHSLSVQGTADSLPSTPGFPEHSTSLPKELAHSSRMVECQDNLPPFQESTGHLPSPSEPTGHSLYDQGCQLSSLVVSRDLAHLLSTKLCITAQASLGPSPCTHQSLQQSSTSLGILGRSESSQCTQKHLSSISGSLGMSPCVPMTTGALPNDPKLFGHSLPTQASTAPPLSLPKAGSSSLYSSKADLELSTSAQIFPLPSPHTQVHGQDSFSAEATSGNAIAAQGIEEPLLPSSGTPCCKESDKQELGTFPFAKVPLGIPLSAEGALGSLSSAQGVLGTSLSAQGSLKTSTSKQEHIGSVLSVPMSLKNPNPSQRALSLSPSAQHTVQCSSRSPQTTGPAPGGLGSLLSSKKPKELPRVAEGTLPVQSSFSSNQKTPELLVYSKEILGQDKETHSTLGHLPLVREDLSSSQSASATLETFQPSTPEPGRHSSSTRGGTETFPSGQGYLAPVPSTQELLKLSISAQAMMNTSQCSEGSHNPLGLSSSEQGPQESSDSAQATVGPCLSTQGTVHLSTSTQRSTQHYTSAQSPSSPSFHTQGTGTQSSSMHCTVADSPTTPVCQGYIHPAQKMAGTLKSEQGHLTISTTAQGFVEPLRSHQGLLGYSSSAAGVQKFSTASPGNVVSDSSPLELSISAQLCPLFSSLSLSDTSLFIDATFDLSKPTEGTLGPSTSNQGPNESSNSAQRAQQRDPSASESSRSVHSSKVPMVISLSGQGTLGSGSSAPGPLTMSLSVQVNPGCLLSVQEAGGSFLSLQGNLGGCTCTLGKSGTSNTSTGDLEFSASATVSLGSSPFVQLDLRVSQPDSLTLKPSLSAQGALGILASAQGPPETSLSSQETPGPHLEKETLRYSPSDLGDLGLSESGLGTLETLPCTQNTAEIPPVTQEIIEPLSPEQDSLRFPLPSSLTPESEEPLPSTQSTLKISDSVSGTLESLPSVPGALGVLKPNEGALGPLISEQGIPQAPTSPPETLERSQPAQGLLEPIPSTQDTVGTSFSTESLGPSLCAHDDFIPIPSHEECQRHCSFPKKGPRLVNSTKRILKSDPFPEGDIRSSLSKHGVLKRVSFAESSHISFKYAKIDSSSTSTSCPNEGLSHFPSPGGRSRHSKLGKTRSRHASFDQAGLKSVPSEDEGWELCHSSKMVVRAYESDKRGEKLKTETSINLTTSDSAKGACGSSPSPEEGLRSPPPPQGIHRLSKSTKTTSKKAPSDQRDTQACNSEDESCKPSSLSKRELRHSSSPQKDRRPKATPQEVIASSISTEECIQTSNSHEESFRLSTSPHEIPRHTTLTRRRQRNASHTQGALETSPADPEISESSLDGYSAHGGIKISSSPQEYISHSVSSKEGSKYVPIFQEGEKPSISANRDPMTLVRILWGFIPPPVPKRSSTTFPVSQGNYRRRPICQAEDLVPSLSYQLRDPALQYEFGYPLCDPSVLGGHRYTHFVQSNLKRIPLQRGRCSSIFSLKGAISSS